MEKKIKFFRLENESSILQARKVAHLRIYEIDIGSVMKALSQNPDRNERINAMESMAKGCLNAESTCRDLLEISNQVAQKYGYRNYAHAKLE